MSTLDQLRPGDKAQISHYLIASSPLRRRLLALGLVPGCQFEVLRRAPLGDPIEVRVRHTSLALRREEAAVLAVRPLTAEVEHAAR
jgi:ferrous iron transport protein A